MHLDCFKIASFITSTLRQISTLRGRLSLDESCLRCRRYVVDYSVTCNEMLFKYHTSPYSHNTRLRTHTIILFRKTIADTVIFATIMYYQIGLAGRVDAVNFFTYLAILVTFAILMNTQLSLFASFGSAAQVQVYSSVTLLAMMLFGGFILPPDTIPNYFLWVYWWNPFAWSYRALVVNEFWNKRWDDPNQILRDAGFVDPTGTIYRTDWIGYSFLVMIPYILLCCVLSALCLSYKSDHSSAHVESVPIKSKSAIESGSQTSEAVDIPFKPVTLSFHNICYQVTASTTNEQLSLLNNVNGVFRPGQMCALMVSHTLMEHSFVIFCSPRTNRNLDSQM